MKFTILLITFSTFILSSCGGGGGGGSDDLSENNLPPSINNTSNTFNVMENQINAFTVEANDPNGDQISYSISGMDSSKLSVNNVGVVTFTTAPDFENPSDENSDNIYEINISVSDGNLTTEKGFTIKVVDDTSDNEICLDRFNFTNSPDHSFGGADDYILLNERISLNEDQIVVIDYGDTHSAGKQITPITIHDYANRAYVDYCESNIGSGKSILLRHADYLVDNVSERRSYASWDYEFAIDKYGLETGWHSSIGNASAMITLLHAYSLTRDERYIATIESALEGFRTPLSEGGLANPADVDGVWFEEYPNPSDPSTVLNGHLFSVIALDYISISLSRINESEYNSIKENLESLFDQGSKAVLYNAHKFDNEARLTTYYSLQGAENDVHALPYAYWGYMHVFGILYIADKLGSSELRALGEKWQGYIDAATDDDGYNG